MASSSNQSSGSGDTNKPKKPKVKAPSKKPATKAPAGPYQWNGTGHHSISQADHDMHVADPLTKDPLYASAKQQATAFYAPQTNAIDTQIRSAPGWYQNYMNTARGSGTESAKYSQPIISNARTFATNIAGPSAGLDPNSPEYQKSVQAGKGIGALAEFGAQNLEGNQAADQTYFQGQATNAAATLPGVLANYQTQKGQLGSQIAGKTQELYQGLRTQAVNEDIARKTLGLNISKAAGVDPITGKPLPAEPKTGYGAGAPGMNKYGYTYDEWNALSPGDQAKARAGAPKPKTGKTQEQKDAEKEATAKTKKQAAIQKAGGKIQNKLTDIGDWAEGLVGKTAQDKTKPKDPNTGDYPTRKITKADVPGLVKGKYGMLGRIALAVRQGRPLDETAQAYLHNLDPNFRIPREWIAGRRKPTSRPGNAPAEGGNRPT